MLRRSRMRLRMNRISSRRLSTMTWRLICQAFNLNDGRGGGGFMVLGGRSSRESKNACGKVGWVEKMSSMGSKFTVRGEECLEGCVGGDEGEVNGGGDDFRVSKSLLAESRFKTSYSIDKDKYMMKAQAHVSKCFAISDVHALAQKYIVDVAASFQQSQIHKIKLSMSVWGVVSPKNSQVKLKDLFLSDKMEAETTATTLTAKLPIPKTGEYDLWLMRIEQYFLMTDYSLREVIKNGNKVLKKIVGTVEQIYEPTSVEEKLDRKNEMKARGTLLMALPNKDQLKFHSYQDAKLLMEAIKKMHGGNKESKKDHQAQAKIHKMWLLYPSTAQAAQMKQITLLIELVLLILKMAMLTIRARRFIKRTCRNLDINGQINSFNRSKVECFNCHKNRYFARECRAPKNQENRGREYGRKTMPVENPTENALIAQDEIGGNNWSYQVEEDHPTNYALMALTSSRSSSRNYIPPKPDLMFIDEQVKSESVDVVSNVSSSVVKTVELKVKSVDVKNKVVYSTIETRPVKKNSFSPPIIEDWISDDESEVEFKPKVKDKTVRPSIEKIKFVKPASEKVEKGNPQPKEYKEKRVIDSSCSRHMTGNKCYLTDYEDYDGGIVSFGDDKCRMSGKVLLRVPRKDNIYSVDLKSVVPTGGLTCLFAKATTDESNLWHKRIGHINYKTVNKLVRGNLVRGLPSKIFENNHGCVACQKGKQHKASYKAKHVNSISKPLHMLHMDLFVPTNVKSLIQKSYFLVITDDFSRFSWVFFLATKDETSGILKTFIIGIENQLECKVKVIRCDNRTKFKNSVMNQFYDIKGIKREFSVARTPQQNGVAEKKNKTLIKATRTMLVDSKLPTTFWAEAVNTICYVLNTSLDIKPHNKTPYELIRGRPPLIDFMKPFGYPVTVLNTRDYLGKFDEKADEGFFVGYSVVSKAMRVFNKRTRIVEETLNIRFIENAPNVKGNGPNWIFDIDSLTISMNYVPVVAEFQTNGIAGTKDNIVAGQTEKEKEPKQEYILIAIYTADLFISQGPKDSAVYVGKKATEVDESQVSNNGRQDDQVTRSDLHVNTVGPSFVNDASPSPINAAGTSASTNAFEEHPFERFSPFKNVFSLLHVPIVTPINDTEIFGNAYDDEVVEEEVDMNNVVSSYTIPDAPLTKFLKYHPKDQIEEDVYVCQPPGFEDPDLPDKVYKVEKALYGLHQAPRAWYETLSTYLMNNGFHRVQQKSDGIFISQDKYVADILKKFDFSTVKTASTPMEPNKALIKDAEVEDVDVHLYRLMIGSLIYLIASRPDITFVVCACVRDSPFDLEAYFDSDYAGASLDRKSTIGDRMERAATTASSLEAEQDNGNINKTQSMATLNKPLPQETGSGSGPRCQVTILKGAEAQTRFEAASKQSNDPPLSRVHTLRSGEDSIKLKGINGILYKTTTTKVKKVNGQEQIQALVDTQKVIITEESIRRDFKIDDVEGTACLPNDTILEELVRMGNVTSLFETTIVNAQEEVGKGSGLHTDSHHTPIDTQPYSSKPQKKIKPKRKQKQATEVHSPSSEIHVEKSILTPSNDPLPSGEDSIQLNKLMIFCTNLQQQVLDLEEAKTAQAKEIANLKKRVKKLEKRRKSRRAVLRRLKKDIDQDAEIALVDEAQGRMHDADMFGVDDLEGNEVIIDVRQKIVEKEVSTAGEVVTAASVEDSAALTTTTTADVDDELTMEKTLISIKAAKPKVISAAATTVTTAITTPKSKGIVFHEQVQAHIPTVSSSKDKGKAKMIEPEKPLKKKDQITLDEEVARKLKVEMKAEMDEEERITREKNEANRAIIEE
nr:putative ribonuclease H-like domain-containing protein [Tanacetum cinerariifolium]